VKPGQPTAKQKNWREDVRAQGCILRLEGPVQIHHVVGRTARHIKIHVGHWFLLPVSEEGHREVEKMSKDEQKDLFMRVCSRHIYGMRKLPFDADVLFAILDWRM